MDFALDANGDLDLTTNDLTLVDATEAIAQELRIRFRFFLGEWFLNPDEGVPYIRDVLKKTPQEGQVRAMLASVARSTPGVTEVQRIALDLDAATRLLTVSLDLQADVAGELVYLPFVVEVTL